MATRTRVQLRQRLSEAQNDWFTGATTGAGSTTTLVDTSLAQISKGDDDFCLNWFVLVTEAAHAALGDVRQVTSYVESTNTVTVNRAFTATTGTSMDYELHRIDPTQKHNAINAALRELYDDQGRGLYLPIRDLTLVVDNLLQNGSFETFDSPDFTNWTAAGSPTLAQETTRVWHSTNSASITPGASAGQLYQALTVNIKEITGKTVHFWCWVYATAASNARIRLSFDGGTTFTNHDYHSGSDQWELQKLDVSIPSTASSLRCYVEVVASGTVSYFDASRAWIRRLSKYTIPSTINRLLNVYVQAAEDAESDNVSGGTTAPNVGPANYLPLGGYSAVAPKSGRRLLLEGSALLTQPSTDAGTTEIGQNHEALVVAYALMWLARQSAFGPGTAAQDVTRYQQQAAYWEREVERLRLMWGVRMPAIPVLTRNFWREQEDSTGRYLILDDVRA